MSVLLAIDSSAKKFSIAIERDGVLLIERRSEVLDNHNEFLSLAISGCLKEVKLSAKDISGIIVGSGPGSFTGLRIGLGVAKGLSFALNIPLYTYPTFDAYALEFERSAPLILVLGDARRGQFFYCIYTARSGKFENLTDIRIGTIEEIENKLADAKIPPIVVGAFEDGLKIEIGEALLAAHSAANLCILHRRKGVSVGAQTSEALAEIEPFYLREVAAKTIAERKDG
jgi:tRNA threonylcarbamoyladenosine biosynthesis protein TsaB